MGADIKALRNRIKSVNSTLHLTNAMGLVASSKIRRAHESMHKSSTYAQALENVMDTLCSCPDCKKSHYMKSSTSEITRLIVIAGDRGLAGGYNANVFRLAKEFPEAEIIPIGKRACDKFGGENISSEAFSATDSYQLAKQLCNDFTAGKYNRLGIISTHYISMMKQIPCVKWVLPLTQSKKSKNISAIFEPNEITILNSIVPEYIAGILFAKIRESFTSEVVARRMAMDSASKNAQEMIDSLQLSYNRARQSAITQEITEIVAGSGS